MYSLYCLLKKCIVYIVIEIRVSLLILHANILHHGFHFSYIFKNITVVFFPYIVLMNYNVHNHGIAKFKNHNIFYYKINLDLVLVKDNQH